MQQANISQIRQLKFRSTFLNGDDEKEINRYLADGWELLQVNYAADTVPAGQYASNITTNTIVLLGKPREPKQQQNHEGIK